MQPVQNTLIPSEEENFGLHEDENLRLEEKNIKNDYRNLRGESLDIESRTKDSLIGHTSKAGLLRSKLSSSMREVRFNNQEFTTSIPISNIKYNYLRFQNKNLFYLFNDQFNYEQVKYFAES